MYCLDNSLVVRINKRTDVGDVGDVGNVSVTVSVHHQLYMPKDVWSVKPRTISEHGGGTHTVS